MTPLDFTQAGPLPNTIRCTKCGQSIVLNLPLPVKVAAPVLRAFSDLHQWCAFYQVFKVEELPNEPSDKSEASDDTDRPAG